ncbi:MAG: hypothetical protein MZV63_09980 [Marinilabiliales bacterium]|nr:hypothetical protein [Marinilabiliales bacterium]
MTDVKLAKNLGCKAIFINDQSDPGGSISHNRLE